MQNKKTATETLLMEQAAAHMAREIDREVLWGLLEGLGWTRVMIDRLQDNMYAVDITYWLEANCKHPFERNGRDFIFESSKDATMFILRWV